jgi:hypothetical protein
VIKGRDEFSPISATGPCLLPIWSIVKSHMPQSRHTAILNLRSHVGIILGSSAWYKD